MNKRLLILGHHYQSDGVLAHADLTGDSFQLSAKAAEVARSADRPDCIVFCGVHFMAETADILVNCLANRQHAASSHCIDVILPDAAAGCPMADMATAQQVADCWRQLGEVISTDNITPVTYVNSSAALKAFCGRHSGMACTSSNARAVLTAAWRERSQVLFVPDQHLGRNTALAMGIRPDEMALWRPNEPLGGLSRDEVRHAKVFLWDGFCCVHQQFSVAQIETMRRDDPQVRIIVHPECPHDVVAAADEAGSTSLIIDRVAASPRGASWGIGTEYHLVERLARLFPDKTIRSLSPSPRNTVCESMSLTTPAKLRAVLDALASGAPLPPHASIVRVEEEVARDAALALERMLAAF